MLLERTDRGLYCEAGGFYVDPWRRVERAVVTHAHADHARWGCGRYLAARTGEAVFRRRLGGQAAIECVDWGERVRIGDVTVSLHPAGHILGSAQVRLERAGEVWVVSGDYKVDPDPTCEPFEPVPCHTFITESTFGLPIYRWAPQAEVFDEVVAWWRSNREAERASALFAYSLGKAQRLLAGILERAPKLGPIYTHGAVEKLTQDYRDSGIAMPKTRHVALAPKGERWREALIVAPPSAAGTPWMRRFGRVSTGFASGWMRIRGTRRRRAVDRGFTLSDHADWPGLVASIEATGAERVLVTHGYREPLVRWLRERGLEAEPLETVFASGPEDDDDPIDGDPIDGDEPPSDSAEGTDA